MKRTYVLSWFIIFFVTIVSLSVFPLHGDVHKNIASKVDLAESQTAALVQVWNLLRVSIPSSDQAGGFVYKANLAPLMGQGFIYIRQVLPVWQRTPVIKHAIRISGFFFALMLIALFYCFYRSSGSGTENDEPFIFKIKDFHLFKIRS